ncbi:MAG TPA: VCBS repeat-containing protein, partial [Saprospiraceae bacterium]|nr:VCBS repeat-containing protein [Saprospiraceae bacterium]
MVTSAVWVQLTGDPNPELVVVGEWMPIRVFENQGGVLKPADSKQNGLEHTEGWWNRIVAEDLDGDGDTDFIAGNLGLNYKFHASKEKPFHVYCDDYDANGTYDIVLAKLDGKELVPVRGRQCSSEQVPSIAKKFPDYNSFANANLKDIYGEGLQSGLHYEAKLFESVFIKNENGRFVCMPLPVEAQFSTVQGIVIQDFDGDGIKDLLIAGNQFGSEIETTKADASVGVLLKGLAGGFSYKPMGVKNSGVFLPGDIKDLQAIQFAGRPSVLVTTNNAPLMFLQNNLSLRKK